MRCPFCKTDNRDERDTCYHCEKDLSMLRLIVQKARAHFNAALEYAERDRNEEAIAELDNALELDRTHVNSHIVMGTLHAKLGDMEKAEKLWREALASDPRYLKAHEYLGKLDAGRKSLPIVRRQRLYMVAMAVFMCVLGVWLVTMLWHVSTRPGYRHLEESWALYLDKNDAGALRALNNIPQEDETDPIAGQAILMANVIASNEKQLLDGAQKYLAQLDIAKADEHISQLLSRNPPNEMEENALALKEKIIGESAGVVAAALAMYQEGKTSQEAVQETLRLHRKIVGDDAKDAFLVNSERQLAALNRNKRLENMGRLYQAGKINELDMLKQLASLQREYPDYKKIGELMHRFGDPEQKRMESALEQALKQNDAAKASQLLEDLQGLWKILPPADKNKKLAGYKERLDNVRREEMLAEVRSLYAEKKYEAAMDAGLQVLKQPIDDTARAVVKTILADVEVKLAAERWTWMRQMDRRYIDGRITVEEAEKTIRYYPQVLENLSRKSFTNVDDDMLFYLGMSFRRIGQMEKAHEAFEQLVSKYPKSAFVRWVKHYRDADGKKGKDQIS